MFEPRLEVNDGLGRRLVAIDKPVLTIGRRTESDVRLVGSDVSREHAELAVEDGAWTLLFGLLTQPWAGGRAPIAV